MNEREPILKEESVAKYQHDIANNLRDSVKSASILLMNNMDHKENQIILGLPQGKTPLSF